jgi:hypothetical protein
VFVIAHEGDALARINGFQKITSDRNRLHKTEVECGYAIIDVGGQRYIQLETYGSSDRKIPGKISQTFQLDKEQALELRRLLQLAFP